MPDSTTLTVMGLVLVFSLLMMLGPLLLYARLYVRVNRGQALIITKMHAVEVRFTGGLVMPVVHRGEVMDISVKTLRLSRRGREGMICKDGIRADIDATFFFRVENTAQAVRQVAETLGVARASDAETLAELFTARFTDALEGVASQLEFEQLYRQRSDYVDQVIERIGRDLSGFVIDDLAIDVLEQTPLEVLDPDHVLDAKGREKIVELTSARQIRTSELEAQRARRLGELSLESRELLIEIERRQADALGRLAADTGKTLTVEQLEDRLTERLREMVDVAVHERLGRDD